MTNAATRPAQTSVGGTLIGLQYLRVVAALLVVLEHAVVPPPFHLPEGLGTGDFGVSMFFMISGAVMWSVTAAGQMSPAVFLERRLTRIVPLYWTALSALIAVALMMPAALNRTVLTPANVVLSYLLIPHHHLVDIPHIGPILQAGWSLSFELFFYALFALCLRMDLRPRALAISGVLVGLVVIGQLTHPMLPLAVVITSPALLSFAAGVVLAMALRSRLLPGPRAGAALILGGLALWPFLERNWGPNWSPYATSPSAMLVVAGVLSVEPWLRRAPVAWMLLLADASYSLYLFHPFFLKLPEAVVRHFPVLADMPWRPGFLLIVLVSAQAVGFAVHLVLERPLLARLRSGLHLRGRLRAAPPAA